MTALERFDPITMAQLQLANLSLDLDNKWAYLRAAGRSDWSDRPGFLPLVVPRIVELLGEFDLPLTTFVVGRDLETDEGISAVEAFKSLGRYEFANHSYNHLPWLHTMSEAEICDEIDRTSAAIGKHLGCLPQGFRGPGFSCPPEVLRTLTSRGFAYDASIFPTSIAPIARAAFMLRSGLNGEQRKTASKLYGGWNSALQPNRPFLRGVDQDQLWEFPVTVMPFSRTPIHFSYFTFLASFSVLAAKAYFRKAIWLCRATRTSPSLLLHPPDFMGKEDDADMAYFPAMKMSRQAKLDVVRWALKLFAKSFQVKTMLDHSDQLCLAAGKTPPIRGLAVTNKMAASTIPSPLDECGRSL
jgi:peptidoglycan-N-acetylglucosamine deacetylase